MTAYIFPPLRKPVEDGILYTFYKKVTRFFPKISLMLLRKTFGSVQCVSHLDVKMKRNISRPS